MSKVLQLTGIKSYVGPRTKNEIVRQGETAKFSDADADAIIDSTSMGDHGETIPVWTKSDVDTPTHDFADRREVAAEAAQAAADAGTINNVVVVSNESTAAKMLGVQVGEGDAPATTEKQADEAPAPKKTQRTAAKTATAKKPAKAAEPAARKRVARKAK